MVVTAVVRYIASRFGIMPVTDEILQQCLRRTQRVLGIVDKHLADRRFLAGEAVTAADLFLVPIFFYFPEIAELKALAEASPNCGRWARDMGAGQAARRRIHNSGDSTDDPNNAPQGHMARQD